MTGADGSERSFVSRRSVLATLGGGGLTALTGCTESGDVLGGARSGPITLEYVEVAGARSRETFQPVVDALNDDYDAEIRLEFVEIPYENMRSQLQTRVGADDAPDVAAVDQIWLGTFLDGDVLLPLDAVADDADLDDFLGPFVDAGTAEGHVYAFPTTTDVRGMYWNKAAFEDAGLDPERPPQTWTDLLDVAGQLHDPPSQYGSTYFTNGGRWTVNLFAAGGRVLGEDGTEPRFDESSGVAAAEFVDELYNGRQVGPPEPRYRDGAQMAREFLDGQYAITVVEGSWLDYFWRNMGNETDAMTDQFGFAPTPRPSGGETATMSGGHVWAAFESTDHPDVVRDFLRHATDRSFMRHLAIEARQVPTRKSLQADEEVWDEIVYGDAVRELLEETRLRPVRNWSVVADKLDPALQRVAFDRADPEDALAEAAAEVRSELQ